jgi:26S proteasome regulatory subunit N6
MRQIALAYKSRSLHAFEETIAKYKAHVDADPFLRSHLQELYDTLLEKNLLRLVEPYSVVEVTYVAKLIGLSQAAVEKKLSQLILDKKVRAAALPLREGGG